VGVSFTEVIVFFFEAAEVIVFAFFAFFFFFFLVPFPFFGDSFCAALTDRRRTRVSRLGTSLILFACKADLTGRRYFFLK
jgi:hypothetical protein